MLKTVVLLESLDLERLDRDKCSNLFGLVVSDKEKRFITLTPGGNVLKTFLLHSMMFKTVMLVESMCMERLASIKCANLFGLVISDKEKSFITLIPGGNVIKLFFVFDDVEDRHAIRQFVHGEA
jgi:hypothetical protein